MRVLVIGSGAREHALVLALSRDPQLTALACAPGNAGIAGHAEIYGVDVADASAVATLAKEWKARFTDLLLTPQIRPFCFTMKARICIVGP